MFIYTFIYFQSVFHKFKTIWDKLCFLKLFEEKTYIVIFTVNLIKIKKINLHSIFDLKTY